MTPSSSRSSRPDAPAACASALIRSASSRSRTRTVIRAKSTCLLLTLLWLPACYLSHLAEGQARLLCARQPIPQVLADRDAPEPLRDSLSLVLRARDFARELGFEVDGLYSQYADWPGDQIVTHVVATRSGEVEAIGFWFPIVGRVPYKGYFDAEAAAGEATRLREEGYDVCLTPVRAYSTLGWFSDPVTGPMLRQPQAQLVETIFHELVHANLFLRDQATFNESAATFLGEEARVAFYAREQGPAGAVRERDRVAENRRFRAEIERARQEVSQLYAEQPPSLERRAARRALEADVRARIAALALAGSPSGFVERVRLNDACLALAGTYAADARPLELALRAERGDLGALLRRLKTLSENGDPSAQLLAWARAQETPQGTP